MDNFNLNKKVYNKNQYEKVIDTSFTELVTPPALTIQEQLNNQPTVNDFFNLYNDLFYEIPPEGETNSHEFLIRKSTEYIGNTLINEEIEALQAEIAQLRIDLLEEQKKNLNI